VKGPWNGWYYGQSFVNGRWRPSHPVKLRKVIYYLGHGQAYAGPGKKSGFTHSKMTSWFPLGMRKLRILMIYLKIQTKEEEG